MKLLKLGLVALILVYTSISAQDITIIPKPSNIEISDKTTIFSHNTCLSANNSK